MEQLPAQLVTATKAVRARMMICYDLCTQI